MSRVYTKDSTSYRSLSWQNLQSINSGAFTVSQDFGGQVKLDKIVTGETLPDFKTLIASGYSATTQLDAYERSIVNEQSPYSETTINVGIIINNRYTYYGFEKDLAIFDEVDPALISSARAKARSAFVRFVRTRQTPFAATVALGELNEILQLLRHPLNQSLKLTKAFKSQISGKNGKVLLKELSQSWLELRFAIIPLVSDINNIISIYNDTLVKIERNRFFGHDETLTEYASSRKHITSMSCSVEKSKKTRAECFIHCGVVFDKLMTHKGLKEYLEANLKDISQVVPTIYELTPYSFLLDYFVNIGDIISASTLANVSFNYACESMVTTTEYIQKAHSIEPESGYTMLKRPSAEFMPQIITRFRAVSRRELSAIVPPVVFTLPTSGIKLANLSALIVKSLT